MLIYHQCGHNFIWNIQSLEDDGTGEGLIISPVNVESERIRDRVPEHLLVRSWMDPQFYLPHDSKSKLASYPFFPGNVVDEFTTADFESHALDVARECLNFQHSLGLRYLVTPTRYFEDLPENYLGQLDSIFVEPFLEARHELGLAQPLLLTVIAKPVHIEPGTLRDELLSWATGYQDVAGVYLIFDNNFYSKQIKDPGYLAGALRFVRALRLNDLEVHVGYCGLEGLLLSVADPTSVSVGSYENLRSFETLRLETREPGVRRGPRPRIYAGRLLQSVEDTYLPPLRELTPNWPDLVDDSPYKDYLLNPSSSLSFQRSEVYKHYFHVFSQQVAALPAVPQRAEHLRELVMEALGLFELIRASGVFLDPDSDHSHLPAWLNALAMFEARPE
jgi:hypothetical protein